MANEIPVGEEEKKPAPPVEEPKEPAKEPEEPQEQSEEEKAVAAAKQELIDLGKAKAEALAELSEIRKQKQQVKKGQNDEEEELPQIDMTDPSSKAWDKRIKETVQPALSELEKAREEVRNFALQKFLESKPALSKNSQRVKELMSVYDRLHTASERTVEGVLMDLDMAYGAITYKERQAEDERQRIAQAEADEQFSEAAISRGATGYPSGKPAKKKKLSEEEEHIVRNWEAAGAPKV